MCAGIVKKDYFYDYQLNYENPLMIPTIVSIEQKVLCKY